MLIHEFLQNAAESQPDKTALVSNRRRLTYSEINRSSDLIASFLSSIMKKKGERVLIFLDNEPECVAIMFGILKAGAVFVILPSQIRSPKLQYILQDSGASVLFTDARRMATTRKAMKGPNSLGAIVLCGSEGMHASAASPHQADDERVVPLSAVMDLPEGNPSSLPWDIVDVDLAAIIYTSGSTGEPKGVMCAHHNMAAAVASIASYLNCTSTDVVFNVLPLSFDYGLYQVLITFFTGGTLVLEKSFGYPFRVVEKLRLEGVTGFPIVPTMAAAFMRFSAGSFDVPETLRYITSTGDALVPSVIEKLKELFPGVLIFSMYGLTECKRVSYLPPEDLDRKPGSVGIPMPNCEVRIIDGDGVPVRAGEGGELIVRGANVMQGYWNKPLLTEQVFIRGTYRSDVWLKTGDFFRIDESGYLYFLGRKDGMLKIRGERVSPQEIEAVLMAYPGVEEAAVVPATDSTAPQKLAAYIVTKGGGTIDEWALKNHCRELLEPHLVPSNYRVVPFLPKTSNEKIDRRQLKFPMEHLNIAKCQIVAEDE